MKLVLGFFKLPCFFVLIFLGSGVGDVFAKKNQGAGSPCDSAEALKLEKLKTKLKQVSPEKACQQTKGDRCQLLDQDESGDSEKRSACIEAYEGVKEAIDDYLKAYHRQCEQVQNRFGKCTELPSSQAKPSGCAGRASADSAKPEIALAEKLNQAKAKLEKIYQSLEKAIEDYNRDRDRIKRTGSWTTSQIKCGKDKDNNPNDRYARGVDAPGGNRQQIIDGAFFTEMNNSKDIIDEFRTLSDQAIRTHESKAASFEKNAKQLGEIEDKYKSVENPTAKNPTASSDVTGTGQPQGAGGGAGGGSGLSGEGGRQGSENSAATDSNRKSSSGSSGAPPSNLDTKSQPIGSKKNARIDSLGSKTGEIKNSLNLNLDSGNSGSFGGFGSSSAEVKAGKQKISESGSGSIARLGGSATTLSAGAGGRSSSGEKSCEGKSCEDFAGMVPGLGGAGALGGPSPLGGLDGGDGAAELQNLFGSDDNQKAPELAVGELPPVESLMSQAGESGMESSSPQASAGEIGEAEGANLFDRVRQSHERAQKRGMLVGVTKRL